MPLGEGGEEPGLVGLEEGGLLQGEEQGHPPDRLPRFDEGNPLDETGLGAAAVGGNPLQVEQGLGIAPLVEEDPGHVEGGLVEEGGIGMAHQESPEDDQSLVLLAAPVKGDTLLEGGLGLGDGGRRGDSPFHRGTHHRRRLQALNQPQQQHPCDIPTTHYSPPAPLFGTVSRTVP